MLGCATPTEPATLFELTAESPAHKAIETRRFETHEPTELLSASAAVLQDLGFQVSESARDIGFLRAAKERSAREYGQEIGRILIAILTSAGLISGQNTIYLAPVDLHQQINASLAVRPLDDRESLFEIRVVFYRLVWKGDGHSGNTYIPPDQRRMG